MNRRTGLAIAVALLGIVASASVGWLASQVAGQRIGLSSEPPSVAAGLVPPSTPDATQPRAPRRHRVAAPHRPATTLPQAPVAPTHSAFPPSSTVPSASPSPITSPPPSASPRAPAGHEDSGSGGGSGSGRDD